jgi:hypothetical protein
MIGPFACTDIFLVSFFGHKNKQKRFPSSAFYCCFSPAMLSVDFRSRLLSEPAGRAVSLLDAARLRGLTFPRYSRWSLAPSAPINSLNEIQRAAKNSLIFYEL